MGWEARGNQRYYYRKVWDGRTCRSEYVGVSLVAAMAERWDEAERQHRVDARREWRTIVAAQGKREADLVEIENLVAKFLVATLIANGFHSHKRQWRQKRDRD